LVEVWAPDAIEDLSVRLDCRCRHVIPAEARFAVGDVCIEDVTAQPSSGSAAHAAQEFVVGEFLFEGEHSQVDLLFDDFESLASSTKVGF
jgi:hypothetical protein